MRPCRRPAINRLVPLRAQASRHPASTDMRHRSPELGQVIDVARAPLLIGAA